MTRRPRVLFVGSSHGPNNDAGRWINLVLAPSMPHVDFILAGGHSNAVIAPKANVQKIPRPSDEKLLSLLHTSHIAINPMTAGGGSNIKIPTYLSTGIPVVTTPFGARGYPFNECLTVVDRKEFAASIRRVIESYHLYHHSSLRGADAVRGTHSWDVLGNQLLGAIRECL